MLFQSETEAEKACLLDWRWPNFSIQELSCNCGGRFCNGRYWHDPDFLDGLEKLRGFVEAPLIITSGHRCPKWNQHVGGFERSLHLVIAADISLVNLNRFITLEAAYRAGFTGFGLGRSFLHIDRRKDETLWYYEGSQDVWMV